MKLANKISLSFFVTALILTGTAAPILYFTSKQYLEESIFNNLSAAAVSRTNHIETYLKMLEISVGQLSKSTILENFLKINGKEDTRQTEFFEQAMRRLKRTKEANSAIYEFLLLDKTGKVVISSNENSLGLDKSTDAFYIGAQKEIYIKDVYYSDTFKSPLMAVSAPFLDSSTGELLGVIVARVKLKELNDIVYNKTGLGETGEIYIINKYGFMITPSRFKENAVLKQKVDTENARKALLHKVKEHPLSKEKMNNVFFDYRGELVLGTHEYMPQMHWGVLAEIDVKEAFAPLAKLRLIFIMIMLLAPLAAWLLGIFIAGLITHSLHMLHKGAEIIGSGNLEYKLNIDSKDEVGQLARAFNDMTENLKKISFSRKYINKIINSMADALVVIDPNEKITTVNQAICKLLEYSEEELIGKNVTLLFPEEEEEEEEEEEILLRGEKLKLIMQKGSILNYETHLKTKTGTKIPVLLSGTVMKDDSGHITSIVCIAKDITERKKAQEALQYSEQRFMDVLHSSDDAILLIDNETFVEANEATARMLGYSSRDEFLMTHPSELSPPIQPDGKNSFDKANEMMSTALEKGFHRFEWMHKKKNGEVFPVEVSLTPITHQGKRIIHCHWRDISESKKTEEALATSEARYRILFDNARDALMTLAPPSWKFTSCNKATLEMFAAKDEAEFTSLGPWDVSPKEQPDGRASSDKAQEAIKLAMIEGSNYFEWTHKRVGGAEFPATVLLTRMELSGQVFIQATVRDISKQKQAENKLKQATGELLEKQKKLEMLNEDFVKNEKALKNLLYDLKKSHDDLKNTQSQLLQSEKLASLGQLSAGIAHEINNPLGFIINNIDVLEQYIDSYSEILRATDLLKKSIEDKDLDKAIAVEEEMKKLEEKVNLSFITSDIDNLIRQSKSGAERIKKIVQDLKVFARKDEGQMEINNIEEILEGVINIVWNEIKYKAELKKEYGQIPLVRCNAQKLGQVFINLLVNSSHAIKERGEIIVKTYVQENFVFIEFSDTGCGIPQENIRKIFDPFFTTKEVGKGTGLGLSIAYDIVKQHKGDIEVVSEVNKGTTFKIKLPI